MATRKEQRRIERAYALCRQGRQELANRRQFIRMKNGGAIGYVSHLPGSGFGVCVQFVHPHHFCTEHRLEEMDLIDVEIVG